MLAELADAMPERRLALAFAGDEVGGVGGSIRRSSEVRAVGRVPFVAALVDC